jgi:hypothetical protein
MGLTERIRETLTGQTIDSTDKLEYGLSSDGLKDLDQSLNQLLYEDVKDSLDQLETEVVDSLKDCWQGKSKNLYLQDLSTRIEEVQNEILKEYGDLQQRFVDLAQFYANEDESLYTGM